MWVQTSHFYHYTINLRHAKYSFYRDWGKWEHNGCSSYNQQCKGEQMLLQWYKVC